MSLIGWRHAKFRVDATEARLPKPRNHDSNRIQACFGKKPLQSPTINHQPSTINHQPSTINHQPSTINHPSIHYTSSKTLQTNMAQPVSLQVPATIHPQIPRPRSARLAGGMWLRRRGVRYKDLNVNANNLGAR